MHVRAGRGAACPFGPGVEGWGMGGGGPKGLGTRCGCRGAAG
jgi:hypothetical protein